MYYKKICQIGGKKVTNDFSIQANKYSIKSGDTLSEIAEKNGITIQELKNANPGLDNPNNIKVGQSIAIPLVNSGSIGGNEDTFTVTAKTTADKPAEEKEPWQNLEQLLENGKDENSKGAKITAETKKGWFGIKHKTGNYNYTSNGSTTYGDLLKQLGLDESVLKTDDNLTASINAGGYSLDKKIPKGTVLKFDGKDLPKKPLTDKNGKEIDGFSKSLVEDVIYYTVEPGDNATSIYQKFKENKAALKGYQTAGAMDGYSEYTLQVGTEVALPKKKFLGLF